MTARDAVVPGRDEFRALAAAGRPVPVLREVPADQETPVSAFRKLDDGAHAFLLESLEGGETWGRYSMVGSRPDRVLTVRGGRCDLLEGGTTRRLAGAALDELRALLAAERAVALPGLPRFCGGAVGYLGLGATRPAVTAPGKDDPPDAVFLFTDVVTVFDHVAHTVKLVTHARRGSDPDAAWDAAVARLDAEVERLAAPLAWPAPAAAAMLATPHPLEGTRGFAMPVARARRHVRVGDVLELTLAWRLGVRFAPPAFEAYRALRLVAPSPYGYFLRLGGVCLAGMAPASLLRRAEDAIEARVLAGLRPRGRTSEEERRLEEELRAGERERAAHAFRVDLARSDLGLVAEPGTVEVVEWMQVERRSGAMHLASRVRARPRPDAGPLDLLLTRFPSLDDCGAPRDRALELLAELEPEGRGVHAGAVGYFDLRGALELCGTAGSTLFADGRAEWSGTATVDADADEVAAMTESQDRARAARLALERAAGGAT